MDIAMDDNDLDISWLIEQNKMKEIQNKYQREPVEHINVYSLFINRNKYIERVNHEKKNTHLITNSSVENENKLYGIPQDEVLKIIQTGKNMNFGTLSKYKFDEIVTFFIDIEPDNIEIFTQNQSNNERFFNITKQLNDIVIPNSIFMFHEINSIYFVFQEDIENQGSHRTTAKSILKTHNNKTKHNNKRHPKSVTMNIRSINNHIPQKRRRFTKKKRLTIH